MPLYNVGNPFEGIVWVSKSEVPYEVIKRINDVMYTIRKIPHVLVTIMKDRPNSDNIILQQLYAQLF